METYSGAAVEFRPLDEERCVLTVASMNGGNVISHFLSKFGVDVKDIELITNTGQVSEFTSTNCQFKPSLHAFKDQLAYLRFFKENKL